jgi:hypothetical protein
MDSRLSHSKRQPSRGDEFARKDPAQERGQERVVIRFVRCARRLLDDDNRCYRGTKALTDGLRYSGLIQNDDPASVQIAVSQARVALKIQEGTRIEILFGA